MAFDNFWSRAQREPDRVALIEAAGRTTSAGALLASANQVVHGLRARGLGRGAVLAAVLPNCREAYELILAIQQAGWYLVPINFHLVGPEIAYILQDCEASAFVFHERYAPACEAAVAEAGLSPERVFVVGARPGFQSYDSLKADLPTDVPGERALGSTMSYTSGTTGRPKGVRRAPAEASPDETDLGAALVNGYGVDPNATDDVHLLCCPWYHTAPLVMSTPSMHLGHPIVIMERFDPERLLDLVERHRVTITQSAGSSTLRPTRPSS